MQLNDRYVRVLLSLLVIAAVVYLAERLFFLVALFATPLLLFGLAWLVALALRPLVDSIVGLALPVPFVAWRTTHHNIVRPVWRIPRSVAVSLVYLVLLALVVVCILLLAPAVGPQILNLQSTLPTAVSELSSWASRTQTEFGRVGIRVDLANLLRPEAISQPAAALGSTLVQQSLTIASSIALLLINGVLVIILSFYMTLDGPRISARVLNLLPPHWRDEMQALFAIVDRTFGGFLRAQLVQALIYGLATAVLMAALGLRDVALASLFATVLVLIPLIGGVFAMLPPLVIALIHAPEQFLILLIGLLIVQQMLFNVIMPRMMGRIVGLHPLLVFAAILVGATLAGAWGILFGIPVAGVAASIIQFFYVRRVEHQTG